MGRAREWLGSLRIGSRIMPFGEALRLRSKVMHAKQSSWAAFRAECVRLVRHETTCQGRRPKRSPREAEVIVDRAWVGAARTRAESMASRRRMYMRAVDTVNRALILE